VQEEKTRGKPSKKKARLKWNLETVGPASGGGKTIKRSSTENGPREGKLPAGKRPPEAGQAKLQRVGRHGKRAGEKKKGPRNGDKKKTSQDKGGSKGTANVTEGP